MVNIFDIQRGAFHDGPGIRTVVFLKGCSLRCFWCQNPESQGAGMDLFYDPAKCIGCGKCAAVCVQGCHRMEGGKKVFDRSCCILCGRCAEVCNAEALRSVGEMADEHRVMEMVLKDREMYRLSGGGLTLSGGEPLIQYLQCGTLLRMAKEAGVDTAVETAGNVPWEAFEAVMPYVDNVLYDIKTLCPEDHFKYCGADNVRILRNLRRLDSGGASIHIRIPVVPGVNGDRKSIGDILRCLAAMDNIKTVSLLPFHSLGANKYRMLGRAYGIDGTTPPNKETMEELEGLVAGWDHDRHS